MKTIKHVWFYPLIFLGVLINSCTTTDDPSLVKQDLAKQDLNGLSIKFPSNLDQTLAELKELAGSNVKKEGYNSRVKPIIITVPNGNSIQSAVNSALPGDQIHVMSGNYNELIRIVTNNIQVTAIGAVNIHGGFQVHAQEVVIANFHITPDYQNQGILISESSKVTIKDNVILADENVKGGDGLPIAYYGIWMARSTLCSIQNNQFQKSEYGGVASYNSKNNLIENNISAEIKYGAGVDIWESENDFVKNNTCNNLNRGIILYRSSNVYVKENTFNNNKNLGIQISSSNNNKIIGNETLGNGNCGIWIGSLSNNNLVIFNTTDCILNNGANNNVH